MSRTLLRYRPARSSTLLSFHGSFDSFASNRNPFSSSTYSSARTSMILAARSLTILRAVIGLGNKLMMKAAVKPIKTNNLVRTSAAVVNHLRHIEVDWNQNLRSLPCHVDSDPTVDE
jgi:hypothetical protein